MFLVFYRLKYPAAQPLEGHQEFTEKSLDLWLWPTLNFAAKDHTTLAQHPRHMRISRGYYEHFSSGGYHRSSWGFVTLWNAVSSPNLQWGEDPAANDFVHVRDTGTMPLAIKEL